VLRTTGNGFIPPGSLTVDSITPDHPSPPSQIKGLTLLILLGLAVLSACVVAGMVRVGALDHPVARSSHTMPTPKGGGIGIVAAFTIGMVIMHPAGWRDAVLTAPALCLAAASYLDDVLDWPFWVKLAAQLLAAIVVTCAGLAPFHVALPGADPITLSAAAIPIGLCWLLFTTNATNFMDGLNGLAAGCAAASCLVLVVAGGLRTAWPEALLVAGIAGFLPFNYPNARIFMGDVGSQFLGFLLGALALRHAASPSLAAILPFGLLPMLLDVAFTLFRRARQGQRLTEAHRGHLYQVAQRSGVAASAVAASYVGMSGWAAYCGVRWSTGNDPVWIVFASAPLILWAVFVAVRASQAKLLNW
jgi:UDP-GlcNAc:undecaprenyl-phosphate GlcNAc-1-phosphate transferase